MFTVSIQGHRYYIPDRMMDGITRYIERGVIPGSFLQAVITNNLAEAVGQADHENINNLPAFVNYFYQHAPSACWGSQEKMQSWANNHLERAAKATPKPNVHQWWAYMHSNGSVQVKRFFCQQDIAEANKSPFCQKVVGPYDAVGYDNAVEMAHHKLEAANAKAHK